MLTSIRVGKTKTVYLDADPAKGKPEGTQFDIQTLPAAVMGYIKDRATSLEPSKEIGEDGETVEDTMRAEFTPNRAAVELVRFGLTGWRNFPDESGKETPFRRRAMVVNGQSVQGLTDDTMNALELEWIRELGEKIEKLNEPDEESSKSAPPGDDGGDPVS